jgi:hypothetical protein
MTKQFRIASLADHPHAAPVLAHWASVNGLGSKLIAAIVHRTQLHGVTQFYLQTEMFSGDLYSRLGWEPMFRAETHCAKVLVMESQLL